jgi:hypothetical protein
LTLIVGVWWHCIHTYHVWFADKLAAEAKTEADKVADQAEKRAGEAKADAKHALATAKMDATVPAKPAAAKTPATKWVFDLLPAFCVTNPSSPSTARYLLAIST